MSLNPILHDMNLTPVLLGHGEAHEQCKLLHRDVSTGNILILPTLDPLETGGFMVTWSGILSDWELAKKVDGGDEKARQPHRTVRDRVYLRVCAQCV